MAGGGPPPFHWPRSRCEQTRIIKSVRPLSALGVAISSRPGTPATTPRLRAPWCFVTSEVLLPVGGGIFRPACRKGPRCSFGGHLGPAGPPAGQHLVLLDGSIKLLRFEGRNPLRMRCRRIRGLDPTVNCGPCCSLWTIVS